MKAILENAEIYIFNLFKERLPKTYLYHNFLHTQRVVDSAQEIIESSNVNEEDAEIVLLACWFHDAGYIKGAENHEKESVKIASQFLSNYQVNDKIKEEINNCILATELGKQPNSFLEEIIKDADSSHLAKGYFKEISALLHQELILHNEIAYSTKEWRIENIKLFSEKHQYYTKYAVENWESEKSKNLLKLLKKQNKNKRKKKREVTKAKLKAKYKEESPERGIQTLYRVSLRNHIKLSDIADTKANILLSVNAIIISLALANLIPKLDAPSNRHLMIPSLVLVLFSVAAIILSIMSTQPKVTGGEFTREQVKNRKVNLLFFGNFFKMSYDRYQEAIDEVIGDKEYVYKMLTKDLYLLGLVLKKKYALLKITYIVFTIGIILSVVAFIVAFTGIDLVQEVSNPEIIEKITN
ncbi:Predicted metal-dependent phosphohydrolase, HD superfamily [Aquimarina amphilecti]|uniref:Predicted metal-dependent phosphohydrolase, HD superfamily n=1 Tax=Aquimarina amphilecti TaxID=1038014 RepID=A0A1H7UGB4_AQUAM|nr:Pycsar system effector family protein [Aquimarina amphilecti]SEL95806.1 Predicted metal-dependent phosphohydrolase, HD superfamily [Aquimarina amphilecti]